MKLLRLDVKRKRWVLLFSACTLVISIVWIVVCYETIPMQNSAFDHFDALIVLGTPDTFEGKPTPVQNARVEEAVREYKRGRAEHIVLSGGPTLNHFKEAHTMAATALSLGVPASALVEEDESLDTHQNIENSQKIFDAHGWRNAEVISSAEHLHRAALMLQKSHLLWRTHAAPSSANALVVAERTAEEAVGVALLRTFGMRMRPVLHAVNLAQERCLYTLRWIWFNAVLLLQGKRLLPYRSAYQ